MLQELAGSTSVECFYIRNNLYKQAISASVDRYVNVKIVQRGMYIHMYAYLDFIES